MVIVHNAVYAAGVKLEPPSLDVTYELMRARHGMAWIGLYRPTREEIDSVATELSLHRLAVDDTVAAHQRPKLERYGDVLFTVLRPARWLPAERLVEVGELHVFTGTDFVVTVRHAESPDVASIRRRMEAEPDLLECRPEAVLDAIFDQVVDEYLPVVAGLEVAMDEAETAVFSENPDGSRLIYTLSRELSVFLRATRPMLAMTSALATSFDKYAVDEELRRYLRDVEDHLIRVVERVEALRGQAQDMIAVDATLVTQRQNDTILKQSEEVKRISSWGAILFAPTLVAAVYGMNFTHMPELTWVVGYPLALLMMLVTSLALYVAFRRRGWL